MGRRPHAARLGDGVLLGVLILSTACATPIGVSVGSTQDVYRTLTRSVLSADKLSAPSEQVLRRHGLAERFEDNPGEVIKELRGDGTDLGRDRLFTLAETSFLYAEQGNQQDHYLAAALYAYAFMLESLNYPATALDPRSRLAADLYNLGLTRGLTVPREPSSASAEDDNGLVLGVSEVGLADRTLKLPFGELEIKGNPDDFLWSGYRLSRFIAVGDFEVRGLRNRYRQPGLGAPLAAELTPVGSGAEAERARKHIAPRSKVPVTAIVYFADVNTALATGKARARLALYPADRGSTIEVEGRTVPLELEPSATLAYTLEGAPIWDTELRGFLSATFRPFTTSLFMMYPYRPGRVPVVLVHGTVSSPARWADLVNEIQNDPELRERVQIWLFIYNTSNPILLSAGELRESLQNILTELDPAGRDPALRNMVLIGHSQGGLLVRLMVSDSGSKFWDANADVPFSDAKLSDATRALVERTMFFEPLQFVKRVVFVATPHGGSFRVGTFVLTLVRKLVTLPLTVVKGIQEAAREGLVTKALARIPTAVDNMRPGSTFIETLATMPIAPGVAAHSIIAVQGRGGPAGLNDGVVAYESAHIEGVESEKIVRSSHSTQGEPETILEIRRILREHLGIQ
jgi:pimeloyl-ACP methyl ester carboxylesterase